MPNPTNKQDKDRARIGHVAAEQSEDSGVNGPRATKTLGAAGDENSTLQQHPNFDAFDLLVSVLKDLSSRNPTPTAAGVYSRMRNVFPEFTYGAAGFASFRAMLNEAEGRGMVVVERAANASDVTVRLSGLKAEIATALDPRLERLSDDLWRAMLDWKVDAEYAFDRATRRTLRGPESASSVKTPSVSKETQIGWMKEFAALEKGEVAEALLAGLAEQDPAHGFGRAVRQFIPASRRWKRYLQDHVLLRARTWAAENGIPLSDLSNGMPRLTKEPVLAARTESDEALRSRVLDVLVRMPLSELLRLPIPIEYSIGK